MPIPSLPAPYPSLRSSPAAVKGVENRRRSKPLNEAYQQAQAEKAQAESEPVLPAEFGRGAYASTGGCPVFDIDLCRVLPPIPLRKIPLRFEVAPDTELINMERLKGEYDALMRCGHKATRSHWRSAIEVMEAAESFLKETSHIQPTHAREIARKAPREQWQRWVEICESQKLTVSELRGLYFCDSQPSPQTRNLGLTAKPGCTTKGYK